MRATSSRSLPSGVGARAAADPRRADEERARSLGIEWGIPYVDLAQIDVPQDLLARVPERLLLRHRVLPIALHNGRLRLAMANPLDVEALSETRLVTGYDVEPAVASETALLEILQNGLALPVRGGRGRPAAEPADAAADARQPYLLGPATPHSVLTRLLDGIRAHGASRLFLVPQPDGLGVHLRLRGVVRVEPTIPLPLADAVVEHIQDLAGLGPSLGLGPRQGRFPVDGAEPPAEARVASYPTVMGDALILRLCAVDDRLDHLGRLGLPADTLDTLEGLLGADAGLLLVAGPPGSGRTTTLYAAVERLQAQGRSIFTAEDPIERPLPGVAQAQLDEARGFTAVSALRGLLGIEPDVVLVGEIHAPAAAALALELARAGSLVLAGAIGHDAASVVGRLAAAELDPALLADWLLGVVAQRVVRTLCPACREPYPARAHTLEPVSPDGPPAEEVTLHRAVGCDACSGGYAGRTGLFELLVPDGRLRSLIGARAPDHTLRDAATHGGMRPLARHALARILAGDTSLDEAHHLAREA